MPNTTTSPTSANPSVPALPPQGLGASPQQANFLTERYVVCSGIAYLITVHHVPAVSSGVPGLSDCLPVLIFESGQWKDVGTGAVIAKSNALTPGETQALTAGAQAPSFVALDATVNYQNPQLAFDNALRQVPNLTFGVQHTFQCQLRLEFFASGALMGQVSVACNLTGLSGPFHLTFSQIPFNWFKAFVSGTAIAKLTLEVASGSPGVVWPVPVGQRHAPRPDSMRVTRIAAKNRYAGPTDQIDFDVFLATVNPTNHVRRTQHPHNQSPQSYPVGATFGLPAASVQTVQFTAQWHGTPVTLSQPVSVAIPQTAALSLDSTNSTGETPTPQGVVIDLGKLPLPGTGNPDPKWSGKMFDILPYFQWVYSPWYVI